MRRVLFHYPILNIGGAEKSSLRMIKSLCGRGWDVTLVLTTGGGPLESEVDPRVNLVRLRPRAYGSRFSQARSAFAKLKALPDLIGYVAMRLVGFSRMVPFLFRQYDAAAVLLMGTPSGFVRKVVRADTRAIWIRNDLSGADSTGHIAKSLSAAAGDIDHFICVSNVARESLEKLVPEAKGKTRVIYNILDADRMRELSLEDPQPFGPHPEGSVIILSVCRLSDRAKAVLRMARVCAALKQRDFSFHWYVAGDGPDRALLESEIVSLGIADCMTLLGELRNPFSAYRAADLVAMLSNYEGLCGVVNEARILEKPVVATRVSGIDEQLLNNVNGIVVEQDESSIIEAMTRLLSDPTLRKRIAVGGYPRALLDDDAKLEELEGLFLNSRVIQ